MLQLHASMPLPLSRGDKNRGKYQEMVFPLLLDNKSIDSYATPLILGVVSCPGPCPMSVTTGRIQHSPYATASTTWKSTFPSPTFSQTKQAQLSPCPLSGHVFRVGCSSPLSLARLQALHSFSLGCAQARACSPAEPFPQRGSLHVSPT